MFLDHSVTYIFEISETLWDMGFRQSVSNVLGQMQQNPLILTNVDPPPLFNVVCHCSPSLMSIGIRIEKTTLRGEGEGCCIVCNKLYRLIYVLKLHVSQQLLKVIVVHTIPHQTFCHQQPSVISPHSI
jgi:hypothetical protein